MLGDENMELEEYIDEFVEELRVQLYEDGKRWGDTWKRRPRKGQVDRAIVRFIDYQDQYNFGERSFPWLKVAGEALIGWVRDKYPDTYMLDGE